MMHNKIMLVACIASAMAASSCGQTPQNRVVHPERVASAPISEADRVERMEAQFSALNRTLEVAMIQQASMRENQIALTAKVARLTELLEDALHSVEPVTQEMQPTLDAGESQEFEPAPALSEQDMSQVSRLETDFEASFHTSLDISIEDQLIEVASTASKNDDALETVECRSGLCRIEISHENEGIAQEFADQFILESPFDSDGVVDFTEGDDGKIRTIVYLSEVAWTE